MSENGSDPLLIFLHIPRTGGTTFRRILFRQYGESRVFRIAIPGFDPGEISRSVAEVSKEQWDSLSAFTSHIGYGIQDRIPRSSKIITFLRSPLDRVSSLYQLAISEGKWSEIVARRPLFLENGQTRMLCKGGQDAPFGSCTSAMLEEAKQNLVGGCETFGLQERFDESLLLLRDEFGWKTPFYTREHIGIVPAGRFQVPPEVRDQILGHNQLDLELYRYAETVFEERIQGMPKTFSRSVRRFRNLNRPYDLFVRGLRSCFRSKKPSEGETIVAEERDA